MKNLLFTIASVIMSAWVYGQNPVIVDDPVYGGFPIPFSDTLLDSTYPNSGGNCLDWPLEYYLDLDMDSVNDIMIQMECYMGGLGSDHRIGFYSFGDFETIIDTNFMTTYQDVDSLGQVYSWYGKYSIAKPYFAGDTISLQQESRQELTEIYDVSIGYDPLCYYTNVDDYLQDTIFIAFKKKSDVTSIYYLKIYIEYNTLLHLISAKTNDPLMLSVNKLPLQRVITPNPVTDGFYIHGNYKQIQLYSFNGSLVFNKVLNHDNGFVNISFLPNGLYFAKLTSEEHSVVVKIVKN